MWKWTIAPAIITALMVAGSVPFTVALAGFVGPRIPAIPHVPPWGMSLLLGVVLLVPLAVLAWMLATLLSIPFLDALSERTEETLRPLPDALDWRASLPISLQHSAAGLGLWLGLQIALLALHIVPGLGSVLNFVLGLLVSGFFGAHALLDGAMSRHQLGFREKIAWIRAHFPECLGLAAAAAALTAIPVVGLLGLPIAVVSGTMLWVEHTPELIPEGHVM